MQVKKKIFPYPVINRDQSLSNFGDKCFNFTFEREENENEYILKNAKLETDSPLINELIEKELASAICIVECSKTVYRRKYVLSPNGTDIILPKVDFTEAVDVSLFAVAEKNFIYKSDEFDEDYKDVEIQIEKNCIIGANDGFRLVFNHEEEEDSFSQSIFSIIPGHELEEGAYTVECSTGRKIVITMSDEDYKNYKIIYTVPTYKEVFFNMILIPALTEGIGLCQKFLLEDSTRDLDDVGNQYIWFRSVMNSYARLKGEELSIEEMKKTSPTLLSQELLGKPFGCAMDRLVKEIMVPTDDGGNENE